MQEILIILAVVGVLLGIAVATYETVTMALHRRKLEKFAAATKRTAEMVRGAK